MQWLPARHRSRPRPHGRCCWSVWPSACIETQTGIQLAGQASLPSCSGTLAGSRRSRRSAASCAWPTTPAAACPVCPAGGGAFAPDARDQRHVADPAGEPAAGKRLYLTIIPLRRRHPPGPCATAPTNVERHEGGFYWYSLPCASSSNISAHLIINTAQPWRPMTDCFLDFPAPPQLTLLLS